MLNQRKWRKRKTSARKGTTSPYFNEAFTFLVPFSQIQVGCLEEGVGGSILGAKPTAVFLFPHELRPASAQSVDLVLAVRARGPRVRAELLGARASGQPLQQWADTLAHARRPVAQWHPLPPAREVHQALALKPRLHLPLPGPRD